MKAISALGAFLLFLLCFSFVKPAFAAGLTLSSTQTSINVGDEFNVNVNFSINVTNGTSYYLRGVFYQVAGNYCGYTWNGNTWYNGPYSVNNGWQQLLAVTVNQSSWSGQLKAKIDASDGNCQNSGNYYFKIQRYTSGGSGSFDDQNSLSLNVSIPTPTPTPISTPTPTLQNSPTSNPTPTKSPTPTPKPSTPAPSVSVNNGSSEEAVLGESSESATLNLSSNPLGTQNSKRKEIVLSSRENNIGKILIALGFVFILACGILFSWPHIRKKLKKDE